MDREADEPPFQISEDRDEIVAALEASGRDTGSFTFAHENFLHLVPTDDTERALTEQREAFTRIMGTGRPFEYFESVYLTGSVPEVLGKIEERLATGVGYLMLHTLEPSTVQLDLWAEHLLPHLAMQEAQR